MATWSAQMWAYGNMFMIPYDDRRALRRRPRIDYPIRIDTALGAGRLPSRRLQAGRSRGEVRKRDVAAAAVYTAWEAEPHALLAWLLVRRPERFPRAAARIALTFDLTLVGYWLVPTAPPWFASEEKGRVDGKVHRVVLEVGQWLLRRPRPRGSHWTGDNPWASMPSDHFATAAAVAALVWEEDRRVGAAAWAYATALGVSLVYLGEHYVVDLLAGLALAETVRRTEPVWGPPLEGWMERFPSLAES